MRDLLAAIRGGPKIRRQRRFRPLLRDEHGGGSLALEPRLALSQVVAAGASNLVHAAGARGRTISQPDALVCLPSGLASDRAYPMLVVLDASGNAKRALEPWKSVAERNKWVVYASRQSSTAALNQPLDVLYETTVPLLKSQIDAAASSYPVDRSRVILTGFSAGAGLLHEINYRYPGTAAAVIDNANGALYTGYPPQALPPASEFAKSRKVAVFVVSPRDSKFYQQVLATEPIYRSWGWSTQVLTYPGGHVPAPRGVIQRAVRLILSQPSWTA